MSTKIKATYGVLGVLTIAGIAAWVYQLIEGLGATGMSNGVSWGLYIACFMFFIGLSAGCLIVASAASVFHVGSLKKIALPAVICSTVCLCCGGMFVLLDVGGIHRIWRIAVGPNPTSPLFWDVCAITCNLVVNVLYLTCLCSKKESIRSKEPIMARIALPVAILVLCVDAWIFGLQVSKEWYSAIMAPIFVASALDSGLSLLILSLIGLNKAGLFEVEEKTISSLAGLLAVFIAVDAFFIGCECLTMAYPGAKGAEALAIMTGGITAPFFWMEIIGGLLIPFLLMAFERNRANIGIVALSSMLVIVGVACKRVWLLFTSFYGFNISGAPGVISGSSQTRAAAGMDAFSLVGTYSPTWTEITVAVGVIALCVLAFIVLSRKLFAIYRKHQ